MASIVQSMQKRTLFTTTQSLPLSQADPKAPTLRRRLSSLSLSLNLRPISSPSSPWSFPRSKSVSAMGEYAGSSIRKWWDWGWSWILLRKPVFAKDLEMNEEETKVLGLHSRGSLGHVFYKVRSEIRKIMGLDNVGLPQTCKHDSFKNFNGGKRSF